MITIRTSTSRAVLIGGQPANGWLTFTPSALFEYDGTDGERKIVLKSSIKVALVNGLMVDAAGNPATLDLDPTEGAGHDITGIYYNLRITADGALTLNEKVILPASSLSPIELADLPRATTSPAAPVQLITGPQGQSIDHVTLTAGTGEPGTADTYTAWGDAGETIVIGTFDVLNGPTGPIGAKGDPGLDGKTIRSGTGAPAAGLGVDGDYYIDKAVWDIYGPKAAGAWGAGTSMIGPAIMTTTIGLRGTDGVTITHNKGDTAYQVAVNITGVNAAAKAGQISYVKSANTVVIYNTGKGSIYNQPITADVEISAL